MRYFEPLICPAPSNTCVGRVRSSANRWLTANTIKGISSSIAPTAKRKCGGEGLMPLTPRKRCGPQSRTTKQMMI